MMNADQAVPLRTLRGCMCELGSDEVLESIVRVSQEIDSGELSSVVRMCAQPRSGTSFFIFVVCLSYVCAAGGAARSRREYRIT